MAVKHYEMFEFNEGTSQADIDGCFGAMMDMVGKVSGLEHMSHGPYESSEALMMAIPMASL